MTDALAIEVSNLCKAYKLYPTPLDRLKESLHPFRKTYHQDFYALTDISFNIRKGETVGIIGKNGSGKSTLLKILTGVMTPTAGNVVVHGRVSALLELGAGFNPELTGIENIYFSGTVMGFEKDEIDRRIADILSFADIGDFAHRQVKTYSSGMFVRLAFAVNISIDPDILIIDEALSVGDIAFRNKCVTRIKEMQRKGVNIVFVSHDLSTLQMICNRVFWLEQGRIIASGDPLSVCQEYYIFMTGAEIGHEASNRQIISQQDTGMARFTDFRIDGRDAEEKPVFSLGQEIPVRFSIRAEGNLDRIVFAVSIYRADGDWLIGQTSREEGVIWPAARSGQMRGGLFVLLANCLAPGDYRVAVGAYSPDHSICYALSDLTVSFSVRSHFHTWGKFVHPCRWLITGEGDSYGDR